MEPINCDSRIRSVFILVNPRSCDYDTFQMKECGAAENINRKVGDGSSHPVR